MVLKPPGIEPTFLKLDSWSPGDGFIPIITSNVSNQIKECKKKKSLCILKTFNAIIENGFNPVLGSIPRLPEIWPYYDLDLRSNGKLLSLLYYHFIQYTYS